MKKAIVLFVMLNLFQHLCLAQNAKVDSLMKVLETAKEDTNKVNALNELAYQFKNSNPDTAIYFAIQALRVGEKNNFYKGIVGAYSILGSAATNLGKYEEALSYLTNGLAACKNANDKKITARIYNYLGKVYNYQGNYPESLKNFFTSLKIWEEIGSKPGISSTYGSIGIVYRQQGNYTEALKCQLASLKIEQELGNNGGIADCYGNIGAIYDELGNYPEALKNHFAALQIAKDIDNKRSIAFAYNNIGLVYANQGNYTEALRNYFASVKIKEEIGNKAGVAGTYINIGDIFTRQRKYKEAEEALIKGRDLSKEIGHKGFLKESYNGLAMLDSAQGNFKQALEHYKLYTQYKDSLLNEDNNKQIAQMKTIYETEKKDAEITLLNKDKELQEKEITKQKLMRNGFVGGFGLTLLLAGSIFFSLQQNKKKNKIITAQKVEVEEKNRHITDSITYALRIQTAILPTDKVVKEYLSNSFILYLPKDIVAGDFYWMETLDNVILFAACDCTGHGVPGAMVSVMCHNALNRSVREYGLTQPAQILDKVLEIVQDNFAKSENDIQDGMDASVCAYYPNERKLQWAGAQNPLWIIRDNTIIEYKADKQSIGKHEEISKYTNHEISLQQGDSIYVFSDGYADQFDTTGEEKLTKKGFKNILLSMQDKPMEQQREELRKLHIQRMGNIEQTDDVCVIGVRV